MNALAKGISIAGTLADRIGKYKIFFYGSLLTIILVGYYCNLGVSPLSLIIFVNVIMFVGITSRMVSASALLTAIPSPEDRGAYMSIQSSIQQISGGLATTLAGLIVVQNASGFLHNYDILGYVVIVATVITIAMMYIINQSIQQKSKLELKSA